LTVGAFDQVVMKFLGPCQSLERLKTFAPTKTPILTADRKKGKNEKEKLKK